MSQAARDRTCRGCGCADVVQVLDLGALPGSDHFPAEHDPHEDPRWPLELWFCRDCALVQLGPVEPRLPEPPLALESGTSRAHARASVARLVDDGLVGPGTPVRELASHHGGSWLAHLVDAGAVPVTGAEPARLVVDVHALAHEAALAGSLRERAGMLAPDGLLVLEFHHLLPLFLDNQFDTVRHGHWSYLSLTALSRVAARHGLAVVAADEVPVFGGSQRVLLARDGSGRAVDDSVAAVLAAEHRAGVDDPDRLRTMQARVDRSARALRDYLCEQQERGRTVLGYGAPSKAAILLGVSRVGAELVPFTVDAAPAKAGRRIPGCAVPIRAVDELRAARPDVVLLLTWDIADEVVTALESGGGWGADYVVPLPEPHSFAR